LIDELGGHDLAVAKLDSVAPQLFVDDGELVAFTHVLNEVDVPLEDASHVHRRSIGHPRCGARFEQRAVDTTVRAGGTDVDGAFDRRGFEAPIAAGDRKELDVVDLAAERNDLPVPMRHGQAVPRPEQLQSRRGVRKSHHRSEIREAQAVAAKQQLERIAAAHEKLEHRAGGFRLARSDLRRNGCRGRSRNIALDESDSGRLNGCCRRPHGTRLPRSAERQQEKCCEWCADP
jgi:hypothetical protein